VKTLTLRAYNGGLKIRSINGPSALGMISLWIPDLSSLNRSRMFWTSRWLSTDCLLHKESACRWYKYPTR